MSRLSLNIRSQFKLVFFDRNIIRTNWAAINRNPVMRGSLLIRRIALNLIGHTASRRTPPRPAGQAPRSRIQTSTYRNYRNRTVRRPAPFKMIYAIPQNMGTGAIIGMVGFNSQAVPGRHELGLSATVRRAHINYNRVGGRRRRANGQYARSRLSPAARAAFRATHTVMRSETANYPQRPFMRPALARAAPRLPAFWANSFTRVSR